MSTFDQLVATRATALTALNAAKQTTIAATGAWNNALIAYGIKPQPVTPITIPSPLPDLNILGTALAAAIAAQATAQTTFNTAKIADDTARHSAGAT